MCQQGSIGSILVCHRGLYVVTLSAAGSIGSILVCQQGSMGSILVGKQGSIGSILVVQGFNVAF